MGVDFTIAVPTHDRRETALLAVRSVLAQTRPAAAVVVLCDGCSDGTAEAVRALGDARVSALELPKGPGYGYAHRNRALELATTEVVLWMADDDLLLPDHLERIGALWDAGGVELVQSAAVRVDPGDALDWMGADWSVPELRAGVEQANTTPMASVSVTVAAARAAGGWDGSVPRAGDWDLWRRVLASGARCAMSPKPTHLHFRASGRDQPWPERVRQNSAWLERIGDPAALAALRVELHRARERRDAARLAEIAELTAHAAALAAARETAETYAAALAAERAKLEPAVARLEAERAGLVAENARLEAERAALVAERDTARGEAAQLREALARIENGGWWRLRGRLLTLLRRVGVSRG